MSLRVAPTAPSRSWQTSARGNPFRGPAVALLEVLSFVLGVLASSLEACGADAGSTGLEQEVVVVTAPKHDRPDSKLPISMQVLDGELLERARIRSVEGLQQLVPGLSVDTPDAFNVLTIRGIGGGGRNIGFDPRAALYVDGVDMSQAQALGLPLFDVERIEVLRGPQGHLFGRNSVAGVVRVTSRAPTSIFESRGHGVVGTKGTQEANWSLSGPLSELILGRFSVASEAHDGFTVNSYDGQRLDDLDRLLARAQFAFKPSGQHSVNLSVDHARIRQRVINGVPTSDLFGMPLSAGAPTGRQVNFNTAPFERVDLSGLSLKSTYRTDGGRDLTLAVGHRYTHQVKQQDNDYGPYDLLSTYYVDDFKQDTQEIRLASSEGGRAQYVMGFYHLDERASTDRRAIVGQDADRTLVRHPLFGESPFSAIGGVVPGAQVTSNGSVRTRSIAAYGNLDYLLLPGLTLNMGARATQETKSVRFDLDGSASGNFDIGVLSDYRSSRSDRNLSPSLGMTYAASKNQDVYARYALGSKSGGWNLDFIDSNAVKNPSFGSETVRSFELGTRGHALGNSLWYEAAIYSSRFRNFQVFQFIDLGAGASSIVLSNAAKAESKGIDGSVNWRLSRQFELGVSVAWMKAVFRQFDTCSAAIDCSGHMLPFAPRFSAALTIGYKRPLPQVGGTLGFYGDYSFHGKSYSDPVNDEATQSVPSREIVNMRARYFQNNSRWDYSFWARNLFDKKAVTLRSRDFLGNLYERTVDPRTLGVEARFSY